MPLPFAPLVNDVLVNLPSAARTAGGTITFSTNLITYIALDTSVTAFTGGTSPTIQFTLARLGADGVYYNIWSSTPVGSPATNSIDLGPGFSVAGSQHAIFTTTAQFSWVYTGTPTSITFSATLLGR